MILLVIILHPHLAFRLRYGVIDTLGLRQLTIGIERLMRPRHLLMISYGLA